MQSLIDLQEDLEYCLYIHTGIRPGNRGRIAYFNYVANRLGDSELLMELTRSLIREWPAFDPSKK